MFDAMKITMKCKAFLKKHGVPFCDDFNIYRKLGLIHCKVQDWRGPIELSGFPTFSNNDAIFIIIDSCLSEFYFQKELENRDNLFKTYPKGYGEYDPRKYVFEKIIEVFKDYSNLYHRKAIKKYTKCLNTNSHAIYYFGYFNNEANVAVNGRLFRVLSNDNPNMLTAMMCDPDNSYPYGSEVRFNNGSFNNNTITIGFTRFIGFDDLYGVGSLYNVDYDFYASNNKISVSSYGTILAESAGSATVYAIYRNDPSKVYVLNITVNLDNGNNRSIYSSITHYYDYSSSISTYQSPFAISKRYNM